MSVNPYPDPTVGRRGYTSEILESLTTEELKTYINHLRWEQQHRAFDAASPYGSRAYYAYRSGNWIGQCREIIDGRRAMGD